MISASNKNEKNELIVYEIAEKATPIEELHDQQEKLTSTE
jgi:hypothetical protein